MGTIEEVRNFFLERVSGLQTQINAIEEQVEQLFKLVEQGSDAAGLDALKTAIGEAFDSLGQSVTKIGEDDPNVP